MTDKCTFEIDYKAECERLTSELHSVKIERLSGAVFTPIPKSSSVRLDRKSSTTGRQQRAVESFQCAANAIGPIEPGMSLFALTRGQWSMIDAILHCLDCVGPSHVSVWTWTVAEYEVPVLDD